MKKLLFFALLLSYGMQSYSQVSGSYIDIQDSLYHYLDKSRINTGVLYNRVFPWANIPNIEAGDSISASRTRQAWHELYLAAYDRSQMLSIDEARDIARQNEVEGKGISIGCIVSRYNTIDSNALADSALVLGQDSLLRDGKPELNPYISHAAVIPVLFSDALRGDSVQFYFDRRLMLNNSGKTIKNIRLKTADGFNLTLTPGSSGKLPTGSSTGMQYVLELTVAFDDGLIICCVWITMDNGNTVVMNSQTASTCVDDITPFFSGSSLVFQGYNETAPTQGKGEYKIYYHQQGGNWNHCDKHIRKPIILIDGFDPGDTRHIGSNNDNGNDDPGIWELLSYNDNGAQHLGDELRIKGYDIIVLNFPYYHTAETGAWRDGGADYIERNAMVLIRLIQEVNAELAANGSNEKIVILGPSMGGQIARYALAYMEKQQALGNADMDHNTRLYISFDSPHRGANIPISVQQALYHLGNYANQQAARETYKKQIRSYAARQLLIEQMDGLNKTASFFTQYYTNLNANGLSGSGGWPLSPRKVALINGRADGIGTNQAGQKILHLEANAVGNLINGIDLDLYNMPGYGNSIQTYDGAVKDYGWGLSAGNTFNFSPPFPSGMWGNFNFFSTGFVVVVFNYTGSVFSANSNSNGSMDVVQGGTYHTIKDFKYKINKILQDMDVITQSSIIWSNLRYNHCFIPSVSSLAFKNTNFNWGNNLGSNNLVCDNKIPFDNYFTAATNEDHVHVSKEAAAWATEEIEYGKPGCPTICATKINGTSAYMCAGTNYTFTLDEAPPAGSSVVWELSDGLSLISSNSSSVTVRPQSGASGYAPYIKVTIKPQINGVQCGAHTTIKNTDIQYGDMFHLVYTEISNPNKYKVTVTPGISGNTYQWAANGINFGDIGPAVSKEYDKIPYEDQPQYFKVRIYTPSCSGYAMEIQGNHEVLGDFMPPGTGGRPGHNTELSLSPNPTTGSWSLSLPDEWLGSPCSIIITNAVGKIVYNRFSRLPVNDIDTEGWSKGVYYIKVSSPEGRAVIKGVKL